MLNIGKLAPGGESYYLETVASGMEDYYTGAGEAPGYWLGAAACRLGLSGRVAPEALRAVLGATDPSTGEPLTGRMSRRSVPGFDCTFRAPKSVSLLYGLGDIATSTAVRDAHEAAVAAAVGYLETHAGFSRRGHGGGDRVQVDGFVVAAFRHRTSRAGDPLLHTHVLVANVGRAVDDGAWRTLDGCRSRGGASCASDTAPSGPPHATGAGSACRWPSGPPGGRLRPPGANPSRPFGGERPQERSQLGLVVRWRWRVEALGLPRQGQVPARRGGAAIGEYIRYLCDATGGGARWRYS